MTPDTTTVEHIERPFVPIGEVPRKNKLRAVQALFQDGTTSEYINVLEYGREFAEHYSKLNSILGDSKLWPEDSDPPTEGARNWMWLVVQQLVDDALTPTKIVASAEGGIAVCFVADSKYADIECLNSGEILGVISNRRDRPTVWEIKQDARDIARATGRIAEFLRGRKT